MAMVRGVLGVGPLDIDDITPRFLTSLLNSAYNEEAKLGVECALTVECINSIKL